MKYKNIAAILIVVTLGIGLDLEQLIFSAWFYKTQQYFSSH